MNSGVTNSVTNPLWKGKAKADTSTGHFLDLNPTITYRHILSQNLGVRDPLRVVALCDSDAFYAACEMVRLGVDKETPLVVLQWESLIAVNYAAREYGISRMCKKKDALKMCPHLRVVHVATYKEGEKEPGYWDNVDTNTHKVSLDYYRRESMKIAALFRELLPGCEVEKASIDEAFIDFTKPVREVLLQRYPYLAQVPADAPDGVDSPVPPPPPISWHNAGEIIPVNPRPEPIKPTADSPNEEAPGQQSEEVNEDTSPLEEEDDSRTTWHDVALSIASEMMMNARQAVLTQLGYSTSAGLARNKFLAKLTASYRKPNGQSVLRNDAIPNYLMPLAFQKIRFLGGKLGRAIAEEYDAATVRDLLSINLEEMQTKFGEDCVWVYELLRGIDRSEVKDKGTTLTKSMLASKNLPKPITRPSEGYHWIRVLAAELALRLNEAREISPNLWPKTLALHARKGYEKARSRQGPFPFTRNVTVDVIATAGDKLWKELVGTSTEMKVTSVQLSFSGIEATDPGQKSIDGFLAAAKPTSKRSRPPSDNDVDISGSPGPVDDACDKLQTSSDDGISSSRDAASSYNCVRCKKVLRLDPAISKSFGAAEREAALTALKLEHDDWHFAQELAREESIPGVRPIRPSVPSIGQQQVGPAAKKKRKVVGGIESFFKKR